MKIPSKAVRFAAVPAIALVTLVVAGPATSAAAAKPTIATVTYMRPDVTRDAPAYKQNGQLAHMISGCAITSI